MIVCATTKSAIIYIGKYLWVCLGEILPHINSASAIVRKAASNCELLSILN